MIFILWLISFKPSDCAVLDPSLYLSPNAPLVSAVNKPDIVWTQPRNAPINTKSGTIEKDPTEDQETMIQAHTLWPHIRSIYFPIQFHLTGSYGGFGGSGVVSSSYTNLSGNRVYGRPLAGSGYGAGLKIFGSQEATWTGWGNGKWGHYGKGK